MSSQNRNSQGISRPRSGSKVEIEVETKSRRSQEGLSSAGRGRVAGSSSYRIAGPRSKRHVRPIEVAFGQSFYKLWTLISCLEFARISGGSKRGTWIQGVEMHRNQWSGIKNKRSTIIFYDFSCGSSKHANCLRFQLVLGNEVSPRSSVYFYFCEMKCGRDHLFDDLRESRPPTTATEPNTDTVRQLIEIDKIVTR
ncbi:hypothetical protein EVAR_39329_1 [Eumeta japonica]|uniref:Uncharacterized protein n=1 Tax=Eumeta variegata TaxID=151549 RepID=A0A4C1WNE0_EUMVA|nr:hypothetical protein EVAR_39329_1 [Eumeta japonica]